MIVAANVSNFSVEFQSDSPCNATRLQATISSSSSSSEQHQCSRHNKSHCLHPSRQSNIRPILYQYRSLHFNFHLRPHSTRFTSSQLQLLSYAALTSQAGCQICPMARHSAPPRSPLTQKTQRILQTPHAATSDSTLKLQLAFSLNRSEVLTIFAFQGL